MILDKKRDAVDPWLTTIAQHLSGIPADVFTWIALLWSSRYKSQRINLDTGRCRFNKVDFGNCQQID